MITHSYALDDVAQAFTKRDEQLGDAIHIMIDCQTQFLMANWASLQNLILSYDIGRSKMLVCSGETDFGIFFSAFDQERSFVAQVTTTDFMIF